MGTCFDAVMAVAALLGGDPRRRGQAAAVADQGKAFERIALAWILLVLAYSDGPDWAICLLQSLCLRRRRTAPDLHGMGHLELGRRIGMGGTASALI